MCPTRCETITMSETPPLRVDHDLALNRFEAVIDADRAVLDYTLAGPGMTITHTFVPPTLRGRGIAEALMKAAVAFARGRNLTIDPQCSYAARYLERHPLQQPPA